MLREVNIVEDVLAQRAVDAFGGVHDLRQGTRGLHRGDSLGTWQAEFVSHLGDAELRHEAQTFEGLGVVELLPPNNAGEAHAGKPKELIQFMPRTLENTVIQVHTGLPVVRTGHQIDGTVQTLEVSIELAEVDLDEVAERLVAEQNLSAGVHALEPRSTLQCCLGVDEAGLGATSIQHELEDVGQLGLGGLRVEQQRVVGLCSLGLAV